MTTAKRLLTIAVLVLPFGINSSVLAQTKQPPALEHSSSPAIRDVQFCELVRYPQRFFNKTVRVKTMWRQGDEFSYLVDERCPSEIAVQLFARDDASKANAGKVSEHEYGGRVMMTAVGVLRNPGKYYGYYRYLFEIERLEEVAHVVEPYQGTLQAGYTYRAIVRSDKAFGLVLTPPLRIEFHYAVGIEWSNLSAFPELERLHETSGERTIVFSVMSDERKQVDVQRWNRTLAFKIIRI
jgi:hypothetical protein